MREWIEIEPCAGAWIVRGAPRPVVCPSLQRAIEVGRRRARRRCRQRGQPVALMVPVGAERVLLRSPG